MNLVEPEDVLVLAFSGHGALIDGKNYLLPTEASVDDPQTMIPVDSVYEKLSQCRASLKVLLVDACRNDPRPPGRRSASPKQDSQAFAERLQRVPEGLLLLSSCAPGEISWEEKDFGHGVFMHYLLEGLAGQADENGDHVVTLKELHKYAARKTKTYVARKFNGFQSPRLTSKDVEAEAEDFPFITLVTRSEPMKPAPATVPPRSAPGPRGQVIENSIGMKLVSIPAGEFMMGSPDSDSNASSNEKPQHRVRITKAFYLGVYEVTQGQYRQVMGSNPSSYKESGEPAPVEHMSWEEVQGFCRKLSALAEERAAGRQYRLPTEAEWEYACRAGSTSKYSFGDSEAEAELGKHAWYFQNSTTTHPVGEKQPNAWGLYDMHGNVFEWCQDWFGPYEAGTTSDPKGPGSASARVQRGGCWCDLGRACRSAYRMAGRSDEESGFCGFRVAVVRSGS